jgi:hypothetical protein
VPARALMPALRWADEYDLCSGRGGAMDDAVCVFPPALHAVALTLTPSSDGHPKRRYRLTQLYLTVR